MPNVKKMICRTKPGLKQIAGEDSDEYKFLSNMAKVVFDDLAMLYSEGEVHELHMELTRLFYKAYTDGVKVIRR